MLLCMSALQIWMAAAYWTVLAESMSADRAAVPQPLLCCQSPKSVLSPELCALQTLPCSHLQLSSQLAAFCRVCWPCRYWELMLPEVVSCTD